MDVYPITFSGKLSVKGFQSKISKMIWCDKAGVIINPIASIREMTINDLCNCENLILIEKERYKIYSVINKDTHAVTLDLLVDNHKSTAPDPIECGYCFEALLMNLN